MKNTHFFLLLLLFVSSCANPLKKTVIGDWTAVIITEEGNKLEVDTREVQLNLQENGQYYYSSTLNYQEAGTWFLDENLLFTNDTIHKAGQKAVMILEANQDTLVIKMVENDKDRLLTMTKK